MDRSRLAKGGIVVGVVVLAAGAFVARRVNRSSGPEEVEPASAPNASAAAGGAARALPRLVDLGAAKCIPCKMMAPILERLKKEYAGRMDVQFIDVWKNPGAGEAYGIKLIPTQIFYDASRKEFMRHEGFFSREDILAVFRDNGVDLGEESVSLPEVVRGEPVVADTRPKSVAS